MPIVLKNSSKNMEIHSFLGLFPHFPVDVARNLNEEQRSVILRTQNFLRQLQIHRYVEFSKNVGLKMLVMISLKMRHLSFEIFFESGFLDVDHCLNDHAASQRRAKTFN